MHPNVKPSVIPKTFHPKFDPAALTAPVPPWRFACAALPPTAEPHLGQNLELDFGSLLPHLSQKGIAITLQIR